MKCFLTCFLVTLLNIELILAQLNTRLATPCMTPDLEIGICTEHQSCPVIIQIINLQEYGVYVNRSKCGPKNEDQDHFRVCCPIRKPTTTIRQEVFTTTTTVAPIQKNSQCGIQPHIVENRIFGGQEAQLGEFPWMARLQHRSEYGNLHIGCVGFVIDDYHVITAAHCVQSAALKSIGPIHQVILGEHNVETDPDCNENRTMCADPVVTIETNKPIVHPNYDTLSNNHQHDIAIISLKTRITFTDFIQPICLLPKPSNERTMWVSGWGRTETDATSINKLRVSVASVPKEQCQRIYSKIDVNITQTQICAGDEGKDTCRGDSGGPLMVKDDNNVWYAEGIVSFGYVCGKKEWPAVYTNIPRYLNWIRTEIAKEKLNRN